MKNIGVIDVGSNSVRLMLVNGGLLSLKKTITTRLGKGLIEDGNIHEKEMSDTLLAIKGFVQTAKEKGAEIKIFGTAAVRRAKNSKEFVQLLKRECGLDLHILSGEEEAKIGFVGAVGKTKEKTLVIDIGGASTEFAIGENSEICFSRSVDIGAVKAYYKCCEKKLETLEYVNSFFKDFQLSESFDSAVAIGGTATSLAALLSGIKTYDERVTDGFIIHKDKLKKLTDELFQMGVEKRKTLTAIKRERTEIIASGGAILLEAMKKANVTEIKCSESDNLIGYYREFINEEK